METIHFQKISEIPTPSDGYVLVATSVSNDGSPLFLFVEPTGTNAVKETYEQGIGIFPRTKMARSKRFRLLRTTTAGASQAIELPELDLTFPLVDLFPNGKVLIAGRRSSWRGETDFDVNGVVFNPDDGRSSRILLGDGINSVYVDDLGRIWVAYGDEGIGGNFGWGNPGPTPVGVAGVVCFAESGEKIWEYSSDDNGFIGDCYALNVSGSDAAIYFYADFPVCRISRDFQLSHWKTSLKGCAEFAVSGTNVLFSGQYDDPPGTAYLGILGQGELKNPQKIRLLLPDGSILPEGQLLGRGRHLYFFDSTTAYRASLD